MTMTKTEKPAVILLSGGLDSATALAIARTNGYTPYALSFRYGQRHSIELDAAQRVAAAQDVTRHVIADIDLRTFGGSALTDDIDVPHHDTAGRADDGIRSRTCRHATDLPVICAGLGGNARARTSSSE